MRPILALTLLAAATGAFAKGHPASTPATLGHVDFPVTGGEAAQRHFSRGLLALHSFWYEEARDEFKEATRAQPDFAMGYWGEALTYYHPIWGQEDVPAEKKALDGAPAHPEVTQRELAFLGAARALVGDGDFEAHAQRYAAAMRAIHERWPDDDEVSTLLAVAILGTVDRKSTAFRRQAEAAALSLDVFARNPDHPGAAHYIIHAFDDPDHARLALPAARRYGLIAPEAFHARHMPSHIFVHLGMWTEAAAANESSWEASQAWIHKKKLDPSYGDFHSLSWLQSIYLEIGQRRKADEALSRGRTALAGVKDTPAAMRKVYAMLVTKNVVEGEDWAHLDEKLAPLAGGEPATTTAPAATTTSAERPAAGCHPAPEANAAKQARHERAWIAWAHGEAALANKDGKGALAAADIIAAAAAADGKKDFTADMWRTAELQLRGRAAILRAGGLARGLKMIREAADLEDRETPSGPVETGVTARERLGEALLAANRAPEALREFHRALDLHPRRARVLLGCARAATAASDAAAAASYWSELASVWSHADSDTPGLEEMRRAVAAR
jgi:tetratricopeptide (TPR) repeat protein